jgi:parvulin-like peptidyl-prolyl isomerase
LFHYIRNEKYYQPKQTYYLEFNTLAQIRLCVIFTESSNDIVVIIALLCKNRVIKDLEDYVLKKKITFILCAILAVAFVFGACAKADELSIPKEHDSANIPALASPGPAPNNAAAIVVMEVGGEKVYKDEFDEAYSSLCSQYGIAEDDESLSGMIADTALDLLLSEKVIRIKLKELGYMDLSDEDLENAQTQAQSELDYVTAGSIPSIIEELGEDYTEQEYKDALVKFEDELLSDYDLTREDFMNFFYETIALENARAELLKDAVPAEEEVKLQYNNFVEADKEAIGDDLASYESLLNQKGFSYYIPEGIRFARHILIKLDDESVSEISTLRQSGDDAAADEALTEALTTIQEESDTVLALLQSGDITFTEGIETYNEDPGMKSNPDGYEIYEGNGTFVESFTIGAMSLENLGDITGLVASDFGYHIIEYTSDKPAGAVAFESVHDAIYDSMVSTLQDNEWAKLIAQWKEEVPYTMYKDVL